MMEGTGSPLFCFMSETEIRQYIETFLDQNLDDPAHFRVKVHVGSGKVKEGKVQVLMDSDSGITIEECAAYSRKLGKFLEEQDLFENSYTLEVASPGLDFPLATERQYRKNIGRLLHLDLKTGQDVEGKLLRYEPNLLELEVSEKTKGKKAAIKTVEIPFDNIAKAKVTVSFK
jgi:ribosome maturation factor RimP